MVALENEGNTREGGSAWTWCWLRFHEDDDVVVVVSEFKFPMVRMSWKNSPRNVLEVVVAVVVVVVLSAAPSMAVVSNMKRGHEDEKRVWWSWAVEEMGLVKSCVRKSSWLVL